MLDGIFSVALSLGHPHWALPSTLPYGARTFLENIYFRGRFTYSNFNSAFSIARTITLVKIFYCPVAGVNCSKKSSISCKLPTGTNNPAGSLFGLPVIFNRYFANRWPLLSPQRLPSGALPRSAQLFHPVLSFRTGYKMTLGKIPGVS